MPRLPGVSDVVAVLQQQTEALAALPSTLVALQRAVRGLSRSIEQSRETIAAVHRLVMRMDRLMDELEEPVRALAPGMSKIAGILNDPIIDELPATLHRVQEDVLPVVHNLRETQQKIYAIAASTERITTLVDDVGGRLGTLPGAGLLRRQWRAASEPVDDV
jgi:ABC-type transporter Mla subunit MlaD